MKNKHNKSLCAVALASIFFTSCSTKVHTPVPSELNTLPTIMLWAWERPEDLEFLDPQRFGVAFLAQTLVLQNDQVVYRPRRQPLKLAPQTKLIAVTRIESQKTTGKQVALSDSQKDGVAGFVIKTLELPNILGIQIDFDAAASERSFYRSLLEEVRRQLPPNKSLSITALASFCLGDRWLEDLPVDEAVPMIFRMGADDRAIRNSLQLGDDFREPLCRHSYGLAIDEPVDMKFDRSRRLYFFASHAWTEKDLSSLPAVLQR